MLPQGRPGPQTLHTHLLSSLPLGPRQPLSGRKRRSAWTLQLPRDPGVPREQRTHLCCCKRETAGQFRLPWPQAPPSLQARSAATLTPGVQVGEPHPYLSPTCLGLSRGQSRAPSALSFVSASLYKCTSCWAPLGISAHDWAPWLLGWVERGLTVGPTAPGGPRSPLLPLAPAVPWKPYESGRLGLAAVPRGWPLPQSPPTLDQDQTPQLLPSLAPAEPHTHPAGPAFLTHPGQSRPTLNTGSGSQLSRCDCRPGLPGVASCKRSSLAFLAPSEAEPGRPWPGLGCWPQPPTQSSSPALSSARTSGNTGLGGSYFQVSGVPPLSSGKGARPTRPPFPGPTRGSGTFLLCAVRVQARLGAAQMQHFLPTSLVV